MLKILCVGPQWRGSDAAALFKAFSRQGHIVDVVDENYYINLSNQFVFTKIIDKIFFKRHCSEFNHAIKSAARTFNPDVVLIYKGAFVYKETIETLLKKHVVVNFYPDVSFRTHGKYLPQTLPLYTEIFTTKTFGLNDMKIELGVKKSSFIPHGFDPDIHRPLMPQGLLKEELSCDVSFIGTYSKKKEAYLLAVKKAIPSLNLKIWGNGWHNAVRSVLDDCIQHKAIHGDLYAMAINASKINLGILSESVGGASSGDLITSRTFHIPAARGFMIHEKNEESILYYKENEEAAFFENEIDLIAKINYYLENKEERIKIAQHGYMRAVEEYSIDARAKVVVSRINNLLNT